MKRLVTIATLAFACVGSPSLNGGEPARPNVLFLVSDDLRPELGCYGNPILQSPSIDRLARRGLVFNHAYCQQAVCSPSRTSVLTGLRPDTTKVWDLKTHFRKALPDVVTLPQLFKNHGYATLGLGKIFHSGLDDPPSWSMHMEVPRADRTAGTAPPPAAKTSNAGAGGPQLTKTDRGPAFAITDDPPDGGGEGRLADAAIAALRKLSSGSQPFFLGVGFHKPHLPFVAPRTYWDLYDPEKIPPAPNRFLPRDAPPFALVEKNELWNYSGVPDVASLPDDYARQLKHGYYAAVSYMDAQLGRVVDELDRLGLADNTIIVLWGDHGWKLGEHDRWCKHSNVEEDTRAPLIVFAPGMKAAGQRSNALVELVDIYPTIAELAGLPLPDALEGKSFKPLLDDPQQAWKRAAFSQYPRTVEGRRLMGYSMRTDRYRFTRWVWRDDPTKVEAVELYDHQTDPQENTNIANHPANRRLIEELTHQILDTLPLRGTSTGVGEFAHPGVAHSEESIAFVRAQLEAKQQPWTDAWEKVKSSPEASLSWTPRPREHVERGPYNRPNIGSSDFSDDAAAAYIHALCWTLAHDQAHAGKSAEIVDAWSATLKSISNHDARLLVGMSGYKFTIAAELLKHTWDGWPADQQERFARMLREIWYPIIKDFYPSANGNWDASMLQTMMAMGVFLDDRAMFDRAKDYFLNGEGNGAIGNYFKESGQCQESGRDQSHTQMGLDFLAATCETAWIQGIDLYGALDNRLLRGFEYTAKYNLGHEVSYEPYRSFEGRYHYKTISDDGRGRFRPMYERVFNHYRNRKGLEAPFTWQAVERLRAGGGDSGRRRGGEDAALDTLMFADQPARFSPVLPGAVPSAVQETMRPSLMIETFAPGWEKEWFPYQPEDWARRTHKVHDPQWAAPAGARLALGVRSERANDPVTGLDDSAGAGKSDWAGLMELRLGSQETLKSGKRGEQASRKIGSDWSGPQPEFRDLRWITAADAAYLPEAGSDAEKKNGPWTVEPEPALPNVLILGDSISTGYTLSVRQNLALSPSGNARELKRYDGSWESLQTMPVPAWFEDGKIGIFIHWGPYSAIGYRAGNRGYAEHVPKMLYSNPEHYYPYVKKRWGATPPEFGYKDIIPEFKAENWNPDEWARLFADVGAKYVVFTAEHHDGWANWDSDLAPWNAVDRGPKRDLVGDLGRALRKLGLKYAPSYHRERHTGFFAQDLYAVHSTPRPDIAEEINRVPEAASLYGPFVMDQAFVDDYVARWKEIQNKYQPDMLWIDDIPIFTRDGNDTRKTPPVLKPEIQYFYDRCRELITDFMNDAATRGQAVYVNNKGANRNWPDGVGCLEKDNLKLKVIGPKWQSCTTLGTSYGYLAAEEDPDYPHKKKSVEEVIHEMVEVVSRNGNFLINIGPKADGTIPAWQVERLRAMGTWLRINGEAIYGSRYWKVNHQEVGNLAFTTKGNCLYAIALNKPDTPCVIEATKGWKDDAVISVRLLGSDAQVKWSLTPEGLRIVPPADLGESSHAWTFEISTDREQHAANAIQDDAGKALQGTKK